jgi:hypothetical protein
VIKIDKQAKPNELTDELTQKLTEEFRMTGKAVWKKKFIEKALLESSHSKCVYCECKLNIESKYMEVEHYLDKSKYPELVVDWNNLLPSCKRCNAKKSNHDCLSHPIINPSEMFPNEHLIMESYRYKGLTEIGKETVHLLLLNDIRRLVTPRFEIAQVVNEQIENLLLTCQNYLKDKNTKIRNKIVQTSINILTEGTPSEEYAATVATEISRSDYFDDVMTILKQEGLWNDEHENLFEQVQNISFSTRKLKVI